MKLEALKAAFAHIQVEVFGMADIANIPLWDIGQKKKMEFVPTHAICGLFPYYAGNHEGNLSLYARGADYHRVVIDRLNVVVQHLKQGYPNNHFMCFTDNSPVDEQAVAVLCGLGTLGRNGLLLNERLGSYFFIGTILCDLQGEEPQRQSEPVCVECNQCVLACPTNALGEGGYKKERCLSYITQKKGDFTAQEEAFFEKGTLIWGCDSCQKVCPKNKMVGETPIAEFSSNLLATLKLNDVEQLSNKGFQKAYGDRAFAWRGKGVLVRNLRIKEK